MSDTAERKPRTEAGRALFGRLWAVNDYATVSRIIATVSLDILAIEDEAARLGGLDVEDWENIEEALGTAASYPQEMEVNRERWLATREKVRARLAAPSAQGEPGG